MKPVWSLGVLLLGCAFGIPVPSLNDNRQHDQNIVNLLPKSNKLDNSTGNESLHQINDTLGNSTQDGSYPQMNDTQGNFTQLSNDTGITTFMAILPMIKVVYSADVKGPVQPIRRCPLPTCMTANLGSSLQRGDEKAGSKTSDPYGMGKK